MPNYDFACTECGYTFEDIVPMDFSEPLDCPNCSKEKCCSKQMSPVHLGDLPRSQKDLMKPHYPSPVEVNEWRHGDRPGLGDQT